MPYHTFSVLMRNLIIFKGVGVTRTVVSDQGSAQRSIGVLILIHFGLFSLHDSGVTNNCITFLQKQLIIYILCFYMTVIDIDMTRMALSMDASSDECECEIKTKA